MKKESTGTAIENPKPSSDMVSVPRELTVANGANDALRGKFTVEHIEECSDCIGYGCVECNGNGSCIVSQPVSGATIKEIYKQAITHFEAKEQSE